MSVSFKHLFIDIPIVSWRKKLKQFLWPGVLKFATFWVFLLVIRGVFSPSVLLLVLTLLYVVGPCGFYVMFPSCPYFPPKLFCFLVIRYMVCYQLFSPCLLFEFFFIVWECPLLAELFFLVSIFLKKFFFSPVASSWFSTGLAFVLIIVLLFSFCLSLFQHSAFFLIFFTFYHKFIICVSNRISHLNFKFLFVFFRRTSIFSQNYFYSCID